MAQFKPYHITEAQLLQLPIKEGQFIVLTDAKKMYLDVSNSNRMEIAARPQVLTASAGQPSNMEIGDIWLVTK